MFLFTSAPFGLKLFRPRSQGGPGSGGLSNHYWGLVANSNFSAGPGLDLVAAA